jgi:DeoR family transcriptional regulator, aga operon transcriptional repressor
MRAIMSQESTSRDTSHRRLRISEMMREEGSVQVVPLARRFSVSAQTIRKDLHYLAARGIATRSYGGAISSDAMRFPAEPPVEAKRGINLDEKARIGRAAAALVQPGESVLLDSGTTTLQIAKHLLDDEDITVVTNDFGVLAALADKVRINVVMLGGALRRKNMAFYGAQTEAAIETLLVDRLFLGVDGFDLKRGITTHFEPEAMLNRKMASVARQVIAVSDSSKFGRVCLHRIVGIDEIDLLITDSGAPDYIVDPATPLGCAVTIA